MVEFDEISLLVTADTDHLIEDLESSVNDLGHTLNYFAAPDNRVSLAEALSRRLPNLYAAAFGGIEDLALQVKWAQAGGEVFTNVAAPRSAAGPSFKKIAIGSGEWLGIPIQATLRVFPLPERRERLFAAFVREEERESFLRSLRRAGLALPLSARLETAVAAEYFIGLGLFESVWGGEVWGAAPEVEARIEELEAALLAKGGRLLEPDPERGEAAVDGLLPSAALAEMDRAVEAAQQKLTPAYRALMRRLKEGV